MRLRTKMQKLEDFVAECVSKGVPAKTATQRTAEEAKRLGVAIDVAREVFEELYERPKQANARQRYIKRESLPINQRKSKLNGTSRFLFEWRGAFRAERKERLPATTRHVLLTISLFMNMDGSGAHPGQDRLERDTGLSKTAVKEHIALAIERGWLQRELNHKSRYGTGYSYTARIPERGATSLPGKQVTGQRHDAKGATSRD